MSIGEIDWNDSFGLTTNLLTSPVVENAKIIFYRGNKGVLFPPPGWKKVSKGVVDDIKLVYRLNSLAEIDVPYISSDMNKIETDKIMSDYYWKSRQFRLELFTSENHGKTWVLENILPILRPRGYPIETIDLMSSFNKKGLRISQQTMLAASFRDVGFGLPQIGQDFFTIKVGGETTEKIYEYIPYTAPTSQFSATTERLPAANNAMKQLVPARAGRKRLIFQVVTTNASLNTVIRYGGVSETGTQQVTVAGASTFAGIDNYGGEISFSQNATFNASIVCTEYFT